MLLWARRMRWRRPAGAVKQRRKLENTIPELVVALGGEKSQNNVVFRSAKQDPFVKLDSEADQALVGMTGLLFFPQLL